MFGLRMTIGSGATLGCLVCGGGAVAGPFPPTAIAQTPPAAEATGSEHGAGESGSLCQTLSPSLARVETGPGGHRIPGGEGRAVADLNLAAAR